MYRLTPPVLVLALALAPACGRGEGETAASGRGSADLHEPASAVTTPARTKLRVDRLEFRVEGPEGPDLIADRGALRFNIDDARARLSVFVSGRPASAGEVFVRVQAETIYLERSPEFEEEAPPTTPAGEGVDPDGPDDLWPEGSLIQVPTVLISERTRLPPERDPEGDLRLDYAFDGFFCSTVEITARFEGDPGAVGATEAVGFECGE